MQCQKCGSGLVKCPRCSTTGCESMGTTCENALGAWDTSGMQCRLCGHSFASGIDRL